MRSLALKLTLAFLLVGLTGSLLVAFFVRHNTRSQFDKLVRSQNQDYLVSLLVNYYEKNGSWVGVAKVFRSQPESSFVPPELSARPDIRRTLFSIAASDGAIIFGGGREWPGGRVRLSDLRNGVALVAKNRIVGYLLFNPAFDRWRPGTPEGNFLIKVTQSTILSAIGAGLVALILGGVLAFTFTRSLRELTHATQALAKGELGRQVKIHSKDELGQLAESFNAMSSELARSNDLRRQLTANIAHDLRTPLSVILGYAEALDDGKLEATPEVFAVLHREATHLNHMIDDLKTLSLADAGELPLNPQPLDPAVLLKQVALAQRIKAENQGIALRLEIPTELPRIRADAERMNQVLSNLVENALRYTSPGGQIVISAKTLGEQVLLKVADNGAGISPEDLLYIFERSYRGDKARGQQSGESGLGLSISKSLVEAQGGQISVESGPQAGATFTLSFPALH